jgi:hypothetical protein
MKLNIILEKIKRKWLLELTIIMVVLIFIAFLLKFLFN